MAACWPIERSRFTIKSIIYYSDHQTIKFAVEELRRLVIKSGVPAEAIYNPEETKVSNNIFIMLEDNYNKSPFCTKELSLNKDGFALYKTGNDTWIIGKEERSTLYGIYHYCEKILGYQWINLIEGLPKKSHLASESSDWDFQEPIFSRRGNIIETINDPTFINNLIDWGVKNGLNEFFFTFFLWDEMKDYINEELEKRDVNVTLGGHSLSFLLKDEMPSEELKFFAENIQMQDLVIKKIVDICICDKIISRISLWPEDIGINEKQFADFMPAYINFTEKLKAELQGHQLDVEVEHIVYNAGLSWNMLERNPNTAAATKVDVLYAYWGRDYSQSINHASPEQTRAYQALLDWQNESKENNRSITLLEYYSDHFMLSELFPPLIKRLHDDVIAYENLGVDGLLNLIVPYHAKQSDSEMTKKYPWKWIQHINNLFYARLSWGENYEQLLDRYLDIFGKSKLKYRETLTELEKLISGHTKWNVPLFPARVVDPEKAENRMDAQAIIKLLDKIINFLIEQDLGISEDLLSIQNKNNDASFSNEEMLLIYFYYLQKIATTLKKEWLKEVI